MGITVERTKIKSLHPIKGKFTNAVIKEFGKDIESEEVLLFFLNADEAFKGWEFYEKEFYKGAFSQNEK